MKDKLLKVIVWRLVSIFITLVLLFALTGDVKASTGIAILLHCFLTVAHFMFETVWESISENW
jgi:uncharacterized membrane protein